jgi:hypothetical protein
MYKASLYTFTLLSNIKIQETIVRTLIDCTFLVPKHNAVKNTKLSISIVSRYLENRCSLAD